MRSLGFVLVIMTLAAPAYAESIPGIAGPSVVPSNPEGFQLGGAVSRAATPSASIAPLPDSSQLRLSAPRLIRETSETVRRTPFGGLRIYFGEAWNEGDDVYQLGTALTRGQTTAGVSVTYEDDSQDVTSSELVPGLCPDRSVQRRRFRDIERGCDLGDLRPCHNWA